MILNKSEQLLYDYLINNNLEITSAEARRLLEIKEIKNEKGHIISWEKVVTKKRMPVLYRYLESYMTAYNHGMYRGGFQWLSIIVVKSEYEKEFRELRNMEDL